MAWEPILDGELESRARAALDEILDALAYPVATTQELALWWAYATASLDDDARCAPQARLAISRFSTDLATRPPTWPALHGGLAGIGWAAAHLLEDADEVLDIFDGKLLDALADPSTNPFDLISGPAGVAIYLLERGDAGARGLAQIVDMLAARAERGADGTRWFTPPEHSGGPLRARLPSGHLNCGVAHGVPGAIAALAGIADHDEVPAAARTTAGELRDDATRWLLARRLPDGQFPAAAGDAFASRTAWCYGTPGITAALWSSVPSATRDALALDWTTRAPSGVVDAGFCHGSAGLAHLANRQYQATRDARYLAAARMHLADTLARRTPGEGIGGYVMQRANAAHITGDIIEGTIGVGLVLLAALTPVEPSWDRLFACELPVAD